MATKTVLIVEDDQTQRNALVKALDLRGFAARGAKSVEHARYIARELGSVLDVAVLDMRLEKWPDSVTAKNLGITGADVGLEVRDAQGRCPPESLVVSAYPIEEYLRLALRLNVAAFLEKQCADQNEVIRHIRALALRRALRPTRPETMERLEGIGRTCRSRLECVLRLCRELLCPELAACLGVPFALLVTAGRGTSCLAGPEGKVETQDQGLEQLQRLVHDPARSGRPVVFYPHELAAEFFDKHPSLQRFREAALIALSDVPMARVSLALMPDTRAGALEKQPRDLARVLREYLSPAVSELLLKLTSQWGRIALDTVVRTTAQLCIFTSQELLALLSPAELEPTGFEECLRKLTALAEELRSVGMLLDGLVGAGEQREDEPARETFSVSSVVQEAWDEVWPVMEVSAEMLKLEGQCEVKAVRQDVHYAVSKLLQWLAGRVQETGYGAPSVVRVTCTSTPGGSQTALEDDGLRMPAELRSQLFLPFTQMLPKLPWEVEKKHPGEYLPLHLARLLIEVRNEGTLEDCSDDLPSGKGHRFIISLPGAGDSPSPRE